MFFITIFAPWWVALLAYVLFIFFVNSPFEVIIFSLINFIIFGDKNAIPFIHKIYFVLGVAILFSLVIFIKKRVKYGYDGRVYYKDLNN